MKKLPYLIIVLLTTIFVVLACTKNQTGPDALSSLSDCSCSAGSLFNSCSVECVSADGRCVANCTTVLSFGIPFAKCGCKESEGSKFAATDDIFFDDFNIRNLQFAKKLSEKHSGAHFERMEDALTDVLAVAESNNGQLKADKFNRFFTAWEALTEEERSLILPPLKELFDQPQKDQAD